MSLTLILNGQSRTFTTLPQSASVEDLISELGLKGDRVAVEYNGEIVPRTSWPQTRLSAEDRLEVVHFVGGGAPAMVPVDIRPSSSASQRLP
jgi:sulfur carrier protein